MSTSGLSNNNVIPAFVITKVSFHVSVIMSDSSFSYCESKRTISSIHGDQIEEIHDVPMKVIIRPFPPELDTDKVKSLCDTLSVRKSILKFKKSCIFSVFVDHL